MENSPVAKMLSRKLRKLGLVFFGSSVKLCGSPFTMQYFKLGILSIYILYMLLLRKIHAVLKYFFMVSSSYLGNQLVVSIRLKSGGIYHLGGITYSSVQLHTQYILSVLFGHVRTYMVCAKYTCRHESFSTAPVTFVCPVSVSSQMIIFFLLLCEINVEKKSFLLCGDSDYGVRQKLELNSKRKFW